MAKRTGTFADEPTLAKHGAVELPDKAGISISGWNFRTAHAPIVGEQGLIDVASFISRFCGVAERGDDTVTIGHSNLHLPPVIFGSDTLDIEHIASGNVVYFSARDALACWAHQHVVDGYKARIAKVPYAQEWAQRHNPRIAQSEAGGTTEMVAPGGIPLVEVVWDWTYTSDYCCSLAQLEESKDTVSYSSTEAILSAKALSAAAAAERSVFSFHKPQFRRIESSGIDVDLLRQRQDILFYDEIILYEDDLEDCGEVSVNLKVRVMPSCWFVLSRVFTRVDGSLVSIRDARFFHRFGSNKIYLDLLWQQQHMSTPTSGESVTARPAHPDVSRFPMGAGSPPAADFRRKEPGYNAPPPNQIRDPNAWSRILPDVTTEEGVHKHFELVLSLPEDSDR